MFLKIEILNYSFSKLHIILPYFCNFLTLSFSIILKQNLNFFGSHLTERVIEIRTNRNLIKLRSILFPIYVI